MSYVHHTPGRIRIRLMAIKGNARRCETLKLWIETRQGVELAEVNPLTGSLLIYYRAGVTDGDRLIDQMRNRGWLAPPAPSPVSPAGSSGGVERALGKIFLHAIAEIAIERSLLVLSAAIF